MLLARLWKGLKGQNLPSGFRGAGLYPLNMDQPSKKIITQEVYETCSSPSSSVKFLRSAILSVLAPEKSADTIDAIENARKRIHTAAGEILTEEGVLARLSAKKQHSKRQKQQHYTEVTTSDPIILCPPAR